MNYIIVGAGVAGVSAVSELWRCMPEMDFEAWEEAKILMIDDSVDLDHPGYIYRPALKEFLYGDITAEGLDTGPLGNFVDFIHGHITDIDSEKRTLTLVSAEGGEEETLDYHKLLLATGARALLPPYLKGKNFRNVFPFRTRQQTEALKNWLSGHEGRCLVIGGGILGVETAEILWRMGHQVTLLSRSSNLLFKGIPEKLKEMTLELLREKGIEILMNQNVTGVQEGEDGLITSLELEGGKLLEFDTVVPCTGVGPDLRLAETAGLEVSKGIHVDEEMKTSNEHIFAAGDCCYLPWAETKTLRVWEPCRRMGQVAGANMAGFDDVFDPWPRYFHTNLFDIPYGFFGRYDAAGPGISRKTRVTEDSYRELVLEDGAVVGASFMGGRPEPTPFLYFLRSGGNFPGDPKELLKDDFDFEQLWYL